MRVRECNTEILHQLTRHLNYENHGKIKLFYLKNKNCKSDFVKIRMLTMPNTSKICRYIRIPTVLTKIVRTRPDLRLFVIVFGFKTKKEVIPAGFEC